jgi:Uma2 family endonuclease
VQPDVSITHAGQPVDKYLTGSPALAIEVISPSNRADIMEVKVELYFQFGAREVWRVYPKTRHVVVHFANRSHVVRAGQTLETSLLAGFALQVAEILG